MMKMVGYGEKRPRCAANCIFLNFKSMDKVIYDKNGGENLPYTVKKMLYCVWLEHTSSGVWLGYTTFCVSLHILLCYEISTHFNLV